MRGEQRGQKNRQKLQPNNITINSTKNMNLFFDDDQQPPTLPGTYPSPTLVKLPRIDLQTGNKERSHTDNFNLDMLKQKDWGNAQPGRSTYVPKNIPLASLNKTNEKSLMRNTNNIWKLPRERHFYKTTSSY